ncbi:MAG: class I SAM-dependent methyltransferase [Anaerolineaceae bacterium]|jgi:ubiquinone/menaquinone biosynthesis C-methylase UbiE
MSDLKKLKTNPEYLSNVQYQNSGNLSSRIQIHQRFSTGQQNWYEFVLELAKIKAGMTVLELGCGSSALWRGNYVRLPESASFFLSDLSCGMALEGRLALISDKRFSYLAMNSMNIAFADESFDLVIANHMLYHVPSVAHVLAEAKRVMKPEAVFMAATNSPEHMRDLDLLLGKFSKRLIGEHGMESAFNLLNGEKQLSEVFNSIVLHLYTSDLWVTDARLLTNYAYSTPLVMENLGDEGRSEMRAFFQRRIDHYGGISIRKETGVYLARNE